MRRLLPLLLSVLLLAGCASPAAPEEEGAKRYEATFLTLFDTVTTVVGYAESEEDFQATAQSLHDALLEYHQLYDIYSDYDGVVNLKAVNDAAGGAPVVVDRKIIDLLLFCRDLCEGTGGQVNAALGGVLALWHDAREAGISDPASAALPDAAALADLLIVSKVEVTVGGELAVSVSEAAGTKCPRCWKHSTAADENGLCPRCASVIAKCADFGEV